MSSALIVKRLTSTATLPSRASIGAAGYDLSASADCVIPSRSHTIVPTGISIALPPGTYGRIAPRSGLAAKFGIDVGAGVIDSDYRGAVGVILFNHGPRELVVRCGDRIAQLILTKIETPEVQELNDLDETTRGADGFGSTGGFTASS